MHSENSKSSDPHRLILRISDKVNLKRSDKIVPLSNISIYYKWKIYKNHRKKKFKTSTSTWNDEFELPNG